MIKLLTALSAFVLLLSACQKEPSFENPNGSSGSGGAGTGGTTSGTKLIRVGTRAGADTVTTNYSYNASNFLTRFSQSGVIGATPITAEVRFVRNTSNIITSSIVKSDVIFLQFGVDSVEVFHFYDAANSRYKYSISPVISISGGTETDSTVYNYASGKLTSIVTYHNDGTGYLPDSKGEYTYTGNDLLEEKSYTYNAGSSTYDLDEVNTYEYDAKTNPTQFASDAAVMSMILFYSANNQVKKTVVQPESPAVVAATSYTYNSNNRPVKATASSGGAVIATSNYIYQ